MGGGLKGRCYFDRDAANGNVEGHVVIVISDINYESKYLLVPISSIHFDPAGKYSYDGKPCFRYDPSCTFSGDEFRGINRPSFVAYQYAKELSDDEVSEKNLSSILDYRDEVSKEVLAKLQKGAKISDDLEERFQKFFDFF